MLLEKAELRSRSAYFHKMTLFFASLSEIASEPKANVGFSSPHGNCFCQFKSNFVNFFVNAYSNIALILLTPAEEDCSLTILKCPKTPVLAT